MKSWLWNLLRTWWLNRRWSMRGERNRGCLRPIGQKVRLSNHLWNICLPFSKVLKIRMGIGLWMLIGTVMVTMIPQVTWILKTIFRIGIQSINRVGFQGILCSNSQQWKSLRKKTNFSMDLITQTQVSRNKLMNRS